MRKRPRFFILRQCFIFLVACGQSQPSLRQMVRVSLTSDPTMLDPRRARDLDSMNLIRMLFEGLTRTSFAGVTELAIADRVAIDDAGLRYVFYLRKTFW